MSDDFSGFSKRSNLNPEDYYISDEGYIIFTESYHLKRGYCCKNSCKHCPYGFNRKSNRIEKKGS
ncbi:MAG: hypothetical protein RL264_244 [Bacteroidota bacterium]|jgi:hypothetical protein